jgi:hypothetical protein
MPNIKLKNTLKPRKVDDIITSEAEPELVLLNLSTGFYFTINEVGIKIFQMCNGKNTIEDITIHLSNLYKKDFSEIEKDVIELINDMINEKILEVNDV